MVNSNTFKIFLMALGPLNCTFLSESSNNWILELHTENECTCTIHSIGQFQYFDIQSNGLGAIKLHFFIGKFQQLDIGTAHRKCMYLYNTYVLVSSNTLIFKVMALGPLNCTSISESSNNWILELHTENVCTCTIHMYWSVLIL